MKDIIKFESDSSSVSGFISWDRLKRTIESTITGDMPCDEKITHFELTEEGLCFGVRKIKKGE